MPGLVAFVFGYFAFRSRIKGVYFSIITQALTFAAMLLFFRNETGFGGNNGFTDFKRILGYRITTPEMRVVLFGADRADAGCDAGLRRAGWSHASSAACCTAIRDAETRVMFIGYNPLWLQAHHLDDLGRDVRHRRRALRAAGGHHQPERDERRPTRSRSPSGSRSAGAAR